MLPDYAVLADRKGGAHFLLIPTQTIAGIENPNLLRAGTPNYFAAAWQARDRLAAVIGHPLRRDVIGLAINSAIARGQDQLHIHIECLQPRLFHALQAAAANVSDHWAPLPVEESPYRALRIRAQDLGEANPFELLANGLPEARQAMMRCSARRARAWSRPGRPCWMPLALSTLNSKDATWVRSQSAPTAA